MPTFKPSFLLRNSFCWLALVIATLCVSCASIGIRDSSLQLQITPLPVLRGQPARAEINAPMDAQSVTGMVLVMGSPQLHFKKDASQGIWYFSGTIPFSPWVQPGNYTVRVVVQFAHEKPHYTEMPVELK